MKSKVSVFWFRRDLRLLDNIGLYQALNADFQVLPVFIFDKGILEQLDQKQDRRVDYIVQCLNLINEQLRSYNSTLLTFYGNPLEVFESLCEKYDIQQVFCNRDYEPLAIERDTLIYNFFKDKNVAFRAFKDQVIFDKSQVIKKDNTPYLVYTPYSKKWKELLTPKHYQSVNGDTSKFFKMPFTKVLSLEQIGFEKTDMLFKEPVLDPDIIANYDKYRDYPFLQGTTELGIALRFGSISIRECVRFALIYNQTWLNELIWREFFMQILYHFPKVVNSSFKSKYDLIAYRDNLEDFALWCQGKTGYPIVDAGMRQLNQTGFMHNRVRMICASFLCKHLLIDYRWGEAYFAQKLNDYDLAANNGNWQWAAGSGCDAAPYFRVFNPTTQTKKFDKDLLYIKKWVPELYSDSYPKEMVEHTFARQRTLDAYKKALSDNTTGANGV